MKKILFYAMTAGAMLLFTGCGNPFHSFSIDYPKNKSELVKQRCENVAKQNKAHCNQNEYHMIRILSGTNFNSGGIKYLNFNNANRGALQAAAVSTRYRKGKYFAFVEPAPISNFNGALENTPEEFFKKCDVDMASFFAEPSPCKLHVTRTGHQTIFTIAIFKEVPENILVYNADDVVKYLRANNEWDDELTHWQYSLEELTEKQFNTLSNRFNK